MWRQQGYLLTLYTQAASVTFYPVQQSVNISFFFQLFIFSKGLWYMALNVLVLSVESCSDSILCQYLIIWFITLNSLLYNILLVYCKYDNILLPCRVVSLSK